MPPHDPSQRLSRITTLWPLVEQAHAGPAHGSVEAQRRLLQRYCGAAYRYLLGAVHDEDAAWDLSQEFAVRVLRGQFRQASAEQGRFRDYVKTALRNLVTDYHRQRQAQPQSLPADVAVPTAVDADEDGFLTSWREELVSQTWEALAAAHPALHAALQAHTRQPDATAARLAEELAAGLGKTITAGHVRVMLHRARARFAELLVAEVTQSLGSPTEADLLEELRKLSLLRLCGPALERRGQDAGASTGGKDLPRAGEQAVAQSERRK